jgi:hypothetical protein
MNSGYLILITIVFSILFVFLQRSEARRRFIVLGLVLLVGALIGQNAANRNLGFESLIGLVLGSILAFLFWLLVGRYNPVGSSDNIRVVRMDD